MTLRVVGEHRRRGVGTALHVRAAEHARELGKSRFYAVVRHDDPDSLGYYAGLRVRGDRPHAGRRPRDLSTVTIEKAAPDGIEIVAATPEHDRGAYAVALEADADIPSGTPIITGDFETLATAAFWAAHVSRALAGRARGRRP